MRWIVIDTNIFTLTHPDSSAPSEELMNCGYALSFLERVLKFCETYGLALDDEGLILEEYAQKIRKDSFGDHAYRRMLRIPNKVRYFPHKNPEWMSDLKDGHKLDKHDRRFLATAFATPDKVLVSQDSVFQNNSDFLRGKGVQLYDAEGADERL